MAKIFYIAGPKRSGVGLTYNGQPITANSLPDLDEWGWDDYWGCEEWKAWHMELRKMLNAQDAALIWTAAWNKQDGTAGPYNWCKYNAGFRNYMRSQGVDVDSVISAIVMPVFDATGNLAQGAGDVVTNVSDTASALSGLIKPLAFAAVLGLAYYGYKNYLK